MRTGTLLSPLRGPTHYRIDLPKHRREIRTGRGIPERKSRAGLPRSAVTSSISLQLVAGQRRDVQHVGRPRRAEGDAKSEEHTSELQSLMRISYAVFCLKKKT